MNSSTRLQYKKVLLKAGLKVGGLSDEELTQEYNVITGGKIEAQAERVEEIEIPEIPEIEVIASEVAQIVPPQTDTDTAIQLTKLIASLLPQQQSSGVDEKTLIALIKKHATKTIEVKHIDLDETIEIKGAHPALETLVTMLKVRRRVYLVGPAGSGKTTLAVQAAKALGLDFYSTGAVMAPYELLGTLTAHGDYKETVLYRAYKNGGVWLGDEIDGYSPRALLAINQLLANDVFTFPNGETVNKHADFVAVVAANTKGHGATREYCGRVQLDGASLDRFVELEVGYDEVLETRLACAEFMKFGGTSDDVPISWSYTVQGYRHAALKIGSIHIISPRASIDGAALLAAGMKLNDVIDSVILKGLPVDQIKQLKGAI